MGLFAFTAQGVYKSIHSATHHDTRDWIKMARMDESKYEQMKESHDKVEEGACRKFRILRAERGVNVYQEFTASLGNGGR